MEREGAGWARAELHELGTLAGAAGTQELARLANVYGPVLRTHDARGHRIDEVDFHPAWHELMATAVRHGLHAAPWADQRPGAHVARAARFFVWTQAEAGHGCPISMTYASVPALRHQPALAARYEPLLASGAYQPGLAVPDGKAGLLAGMGMTEKQGGSDVRANTTRAVPDPAAGDGGYRLTGHKWFCSAPMCDLFLVLAQAPEGLTCFLLPRVRPDGSRNDMRIQRLKDKLGNRSNASAEVEYDDALAWLVGEPGRGIATIIEMVSATRLDCVLGSAAQMRLGCVTAADYVSQRQAFGSALIDYPLMASVIADLTLESEAATALAIRLAGAADRAARGDAAEADFLRLALPAAKYWVCKRTPLVTGEALECLGGNGYVEDSPHAPAVPGRAAELDLGGLGQHHGPGRAPGPDPDAPGGRGGAGRDRRGGRGRPAAGPGRGPAARGPGRRGQGRRRGGPTRPAGWPGCWPWCSRPRCWPGTPRRRSPTRSAPPGWTRRRPLAWADPAARSAPCPTAWRWPRC